MDKVYTMKLHEVIDGQGANGNTRILRVPGGWIYSIYFENSLSSVFVPYEKTDITEKITNSLLTWIDEQRDEFSSMPDDNKFYKGYYNALKDFGIIIKTLT